ncbi:hypothetical protein K469DRAFT_604595, partial [Zopfia rhizophila CBS 207.26]
QLKRPFHLNIADGTEFRGGPVTSYITAKLRINNYTEIIRLFATTLGSHSIVLGVYWLRRHNLQID